MIIINAVFETNTSSAVGEKVRKLCHFEVSEFSVQDTR